MSQTKKYWYCDGTVLTTVDVTMSNETSACSNMVEYDDGYNVYKTYTKTITIALSHSCPVALTVRYQYTQNRYVDYELVYSGALTSNFTIPAGSTHKTFTVTCKEERWVHVDSNGLLIPQTQ